MSLLKIRIEKGPEERMVGDLFEGTKDNRCKTLRTKNTVHKKY